MEASGERVERTYGAWWLAKSFGLFGLQAWGTVALFVALVVWVPVMIFGGLLPGMALFVVVVPPVWWASAAEGQLAVPVWAGRPGADGAVHAAGDPGVDDFARVRGRVPA
jgi:hypothetical protein